MNRTACASIVLTAAMLTLSASGASAQGTVRQRAACTGDAFKFCGQFIPDVPAITACMKTNYASLSPGCRAQFPRNGKQQPL